MRETALIRELTRDEEGGLLPGFSETIIRQIKRPAKVDLWKVIVAVRDLNKDLKPHTTIRVHIVGPL